VLHFDKLLDTNNSEFAQSGNVQLNAATPTDSPDRVLILTTDGDWLQRLP
jgi:hypothetical protein